MWVSVCPELSVVLSNGVATCNGNLELIQIPYSGLGIPLDDVPEIVGLILFTFITAFGIKVVVNLFFPFK